MDRIIKVQEAIIRQKLFFGLLLSVMVLMVFQQKIAQPIVWIFSYMVLEDFLHQTIDMRVFAILVAFMTYYSSGLYAFITTGFLTGILFRIVFLLSVRKRKIQDAQDTKEENHPEKDITRIPFGYLPSLGMSLLLYVFVIVNLAIPGWLLPTHEGILYLYDFFLQDLYIRSVMLVFLFCPWVFLEKRLERLERSGTELQYGFGDGDVLVLGAFAGFLGFETLLVVFFVSLFIQLIWHLIYFRSDVYAGK
jgi:hypothetical protein